MDDPKYGKYRGLVLNNIDPLFKGRILVQVPDVFAVGTSNWAMPSVPIAGRQQGVYVVPPLQSGVWVEFEGGDPQKPIWSGGFWAEGEVPALALAPAIPGAPNIVLQTL